MPNHFYRSSFLGADCRHKHRTREDAEDCAIKRWRSATKKGPAAPWGIVKEEDAARFVRSCHEQGERS